MKYLFIDKNTWGYYDDELKLLGNYDSELGNIYVAKITKYDKKLDAFFIEYDKKKTGFLNIICLNVSSDKALHKGSLEFNTTLAWH